MGNGPAVRPKEVIECVRKDGAKAVELQCWPEWFNTLVGDKAGAAKEARRRNFSKIITYTLISEPGTSLVAAGWTREAETRGGSWSRINRPRIDRAPTCAKVRWSRTL